MFLLYANSASAERTLHHETGAYTAPLGFQSHPLFNIEQEKLWQ